MSVNPNHIIDPNEPFDALLVLSFGGPESMDDVMPFLENVTRGRGVPRERLLEVAHHYEMFDGVSPINAQNRALIAALQAEFETNGLNLPIYFGNRNWHPFLTDTMRQMRDDGVKNALAFFTSAYSSYSGCRQYRENIMAAQEEVGEGAPKVSLLRKFYNHPGFVEPNIANIRAALEQIPAERRDGAYVAFTAHSIPQSMADNCMYEVQLADTCQIIAEALNLKQWKLVYQSRSGSPSIPWLEPDILDHMRDLHQQGTTDLVIAPVGFISDHMEVMFDLDVEALELAGELGMTMIRAASVGTHPQFVRMIYDLIIERMTQNPDKPALGSRGASHDVCPLNCCLPGTMRRPQPASADAASA